MNGVVFPVDFSFMKLERAHPRAKFDCRQPKVDQWLRTKALRHQDKHLSVTKALLSPAGRIAGFYSLATGQVDFSDLPTEIVHKLPRRPLPVAVLAWLGVNIHHQGLGLGQSLLAQALQDCHDAGQSFALFAVIIDCISESAKSFYLQWDFAELPGHPFRLYLSANALAAMAGRT